MATRQQTEQRRAAGKASGDKRRRREPSELHNPDAALPAPSAPIAGRMKVYDEMVGKPKSWPEVKDRVAVEAGIFKILEAERAFAIAAKDQWTSEQVKARERRVNEANKVRLDLVERLLDAVPAITPEQRKSYLEAARIWRTETDRALAALHA